MQAKSTFEIVSWDQTSYDKPELGSELGRAEVKKRIRGEVEAESTAILLLCQAADGSAGYVASERVTGQIGERSGSFVIQHGGAVSGGQVFDQFGYVVPGSGTGELEGLRGHCVWYHDEHEATFTLDYEFV